MKRAPLKAGIIAASALFTVGGWGSIAATASTADAAPAGARLDWMEIEHPQPAQVRAALEAVNCAGIDVREGREPRITVGVACPRGVVVA